MSVAAHATEGAHGGGHEASLHVQNLVGVLAHYLPGPVGDFLLRFENVIFTVLVVAILGLLFGAASRRPAMIPGRLQLACEAIVEGLAGFVTGILGPQGRKYVP